MSTSATISSSTDIYGNTYTTSVSNDELESEDFLQLMLTELSLQDPTDPVDASSMLDTQLQLSTLEANMATVDAMASLQTTFEQTALSTASSMIGNIIENGETDDEGNVKQYSVSSVSMQDGEITLSAYEISSYYDVYYFDEVESSDSEIASTSENDTITIRNSDGESYEFSTYGKTYNELAQEISAVDGLSASMAQNNSGNYQLVVSVNNGNSSISQSGVNLTYNTDTATAYNSEIQTIAYEDITKIY